MALISSHYQYFPLFVPLFLLMALQHFQTIDPFQFLILICKGFEQLIQLILPLGLLERSFQLPLVLHLLVRVSIMNYFDALILRFQIILLHFTRLYISVQFNFDHNLHLKSIQSCSHNPRFRYRYPLQGKFMHLKIQGIQIYQRVQLQMASLIICLVRSFLQTQHYQHLLPPLGQTTLTTRRLLHRFDLELHPAHLADL